MHGMTYSDEKDPKVSVIIPTYNSEKYLKAAVDSILNQTFQDFEMLVIDDNSTDKTLEILKSCNNPKIKIIQQGGQKGISFALNIGLDTARGEYIVRMDTDDISFPERLEKQVAYMDNNPDIDICGCAAQNFDDNGNLLSIWRNPSDDRQIRTLLLDQVSLIHPSVIMRKSTLDKYGLRYSKIYNVTEDFDLWTRASKFVKFHNLEEVLLYYRTHNTKATVIKANQGREVFLEILRNGFKDKFDVDVPVNLMDAFWFGLKDIRAFSHDELSKILEIFNSVLKKVTQSGEYDNDLFFALISRKWNYLQNAYTSRQAESAKQNSDCSIVN